MAKQRQSKFAHMQKVVQRAARSVLRGCAPQHSITISKRIYKKALQREISSVTIHLANQNQTEKFVCSPRRVSKLAAGWGSPDTPPQN